MSDEAAYRARMLPVLRGTLANVETQLTTAWHAYDRASRGLETARYNPRQVSVFKATCDRLEDSKKQLLERIAEYTKPIGEFEWLK